MCIRDRPTTKNALPTSKNSKLPTKNTKPSNKNNMGGDTESQFTAAIVNGSGLLAAPVNIIDIGEYKEVQAISAGRRNSLSYNSPWEDSPWESLEEDFTKVTDKKAYRKHKRSSTTSPTETRLKKLSRTNLTK